MDERTGLMVPLAIALSASAIMFCVVWRRKAVTVGLPLCYLIALGMIHFLGALIYLFATYEMESVSTVARGFKECSHGVIALLAGVLLADYGTNKRPLSAMPSEHGLKNNRLLPIYNYRVVSRRETRHLFLADWRPSHETLRHRRLVPMTGFYIAAGLLFVCFGAPFLRDVPSVAAVAHCGELLLVAGVCLAVWHARRSEEKGAFLFWLGTTLCFPLFTMITMGFLGYGVVAASVIWCFTSVLFWPRWVNLLVLGLVFYFSLSAYVTYMRDRDELRLIIWNNESSYWDRGTKLAEMFRRFEFFNVENPSHIQAIDIRLNQNYLVGTAAWALESGVVDFARGRTLYEAALALVPRILWADKPVRAGSPEIVAHYTGLQFAEGTSVGVGHVMELYINFGRWGILFGFLVMGVIVRWLDFEAALRLARGDDAGFVAWFVPALAFLNVGGSLVELFGTIAASTVLVFTMNRLLLSKLSSKA